MLRLLLVRHARAGARGRGPADLERPLDDEGRAQAAALPGLLLPHVEGALDVVSSPARRCIETVGPLAETLGTTVAIDPALVEGADPRALERRIASLERSTAWASHGDVIPELLGMLARRGVDLGPRPRCSKGSTWVLDVVAGEVAAARYVPAPRC